MNYAKALLPAFLFALACGGTPAVAADALEFTITRAELPKLTYNELTIRVDACGASRAAVAVDGKPVECRIDNDKVIFTTAGAKATVTLVGVKDKSRLGKASKAVLRDDKLWAWSNGFDDNKSYKTTAIPLLDKYGYRSTVYLIGSIVNETRNEGWIIDGPDVISLVKKGWGIGNHSWNHTVVPAEKGAAVAKYGTPDWAPTPADMDKAKESYRQTYKMLRALCDKAGRSDYRLIAFAAPMFDSRWQPVIADMKKNADSEVLFNESGNRALVVVDGDWKAANQYASPSKYDLNTSIGRDWAIEVFGSGSKDDPKDKLAKEIAKCGESYHLWYNTMCHGVADKHGIFKLVPWVHDTYGKGGNNTVWVAPADEIYSYLLVRDNTTVTYKGASAVADPPVTTAPATTPATTSAPAASTSKPAN